MNPELEHLKAWLKRKKLSPASIQSSLNKVIAFQKWLHEQYLDEKLVRPSDILAYLQHCKEKGNQNKTLAQKLKAIKRLYDYLELKPNPATHLHIRGITKTIPSGLLTEGELSVIYQNYPQNNPHQIRNKVLLGLIIYQALRSGECIKLQVEHLNLNLRLIEVPSAKRSAKRNLQLQELQLPLIQSYLDTIRPKLLQIKTNQFFINSGHSHRPEKLLNTINRLIKELKRKYAYLKNIHQLRASRIALWLKTHNLREVQYMAGHRYISSTERYQIQKVEDLQKQLDQYHPLK